MRANLKKSGTSPKQIPQLINDKYQTMQENINMCMKNEQNLNEQIQYIYSHSAKRDKDLIEMYQLIKLIGNEHRQRERQNNELDSFVLDTNKRLDALEDCFFSLQKQIDDSTSKIDELKKSLNTVNKKIDDLSTNVLPPDDKDLLQTFYNSLNEMNTESIKLNNRLKKQKRLISELFHF